MLTPVEMAVVRAIVATSLLGIFIYKFDSSQRAYISKFWLYEDLQSTSALTICFNSD